MTTYRKWRRIKNYYTDSMGARKHSDETYKKIIDAVLNEGLSQVDAAKRYGVQPKTFYQHCSVKGIDLPSGGRKAAGVRKLNEQAAKLLKETNLSAQ